MIISIWNQCESRMSSAFAAALSVTAVFLIPCSIAMLEGAVNESSIGDVLLDKSYSRDLNTDIVYNVLREPGTDVINYVSERYGRRILSKNIIEVIYKALYYVPQFYDIRNDVFDCRLCENIDSYVVEADKISDFTVVNASAAESMVSMEAVNMADKVIVLINSLPEDFDRFVKRYHLILHKCCFVVFSSLEINEDEVMHRCSSSGVNPNSVFIIPCTCSFEKSAATGTLYDYIRKNFRCNCHCPEYKVIDGFTRLSDFVFKSAFEDDGKGVL